MYVEDLIIAIARKLDTSFYHFGGLFKPRSWHRTFVLDVRDGLLAGRALSTRQAAVALRLCAQIASDLVEYRMIGSAALAELLADPQYRQPPYESIVLPREVRYLGDNLLGFRFKPDDNVRAALKGAASRPIDTPGLLRSLAYPTRSRFDWQYKIWIIAIEHYNFIAIRRLIMRCRFHVDEAVANYLHACEEPDARSTVRFVDPDVLAVTVRNHEIFACWASEVAQGLVL